MCGFIGVDFNEVFDWRPIALNRLISSALHEVKLLLKLVALRIRVAQRVYSIGDCPDSGLSLLDCVTKGSQVAHSQIQPLLVSHVQVLDAMETLEATWRHLPV